MPLPLRRHLRRGARWLSVALETPGETQARILYQHLESVLIEIAIDLGLFLVLDEDEGAPKPLERLANTTGADEVLLGRLLRALSAVQAIQNVGPNLFAPTNVSRTFTDPTLRDGCKFCLGFAAKVWQCLPEFLQATQYANPTDSQNCALSYAFNTHDSVFNVMSRQPHMISFFNSYMTGQRRDRANWLDFYPLEDRLSKLSVRCQDQVSIVDVGGAQGHELRAIKDRFPDLPGHMVLQDRPEIIRTVHADGIFEAMSHDFFQSQPVKGARAYYFRNIFHDWSDEECANIIKSTASAMIPGYSIILINEWCLAEETPSSFAALSDFNMMALCAGMERTKKQWRALLGSTNLRVNGIWTASSDSESLIEASLE